VRRPSVIVHLPLKQRAASQAKEEAEPPLPLVMISDELEQLHWILNQNVFLTGVLLIYSISSSSHPRTTATTAAVVAVAVQQARHPLPTCSMAAAVSYGLVEGLIVGGVGRMGQVRGGMIGIQRERW